jgi:ABC-2 type transport system ATP-binding protein
LLNFFFTHIPNGLTRVMVEPREDELVIEAQGLRMEFRGLVAVESLDLSIAKGTLYGLIGPNGSGKTTAIKMLVGLLRPSGGQAMVLGESVPLQSNWTKLDYMPQENAVYGDLTIQENLKFFGGLYSVPKEALTIRMDELLNVVDLASRQDSLVSQLSRGLKHRVSLSCALMHETSVPSGRFIIIFDQALRTIAFPFRKVDSNPPTYHVHQERGDNGRP